MAVSKSNKPQAIPIDAIMLDGLTQSRTRTNPEVVEQYADAIRDGVELPPVDLFTEDGEVYYIGDGIHRCASHVVAKRVSIMAIVHQGGLHEAQVFACAANKTHGLYRSNADKRHAVAKMLELESKWSNRRIAEHVGVAATLVGQIRKDMEEANEIKSTSKREGRDGRTYDSASLENKGKEARLSQNYTPPAGDEGDEFDPDEFEEAVVTADEERYCDYLEQPLNGEQAAVFDDEPFIDETIGLLLAAERNARQLSKTPAGKFLTFKRFRAAIKEAIGQLEATRPFALCPYCNGRKCTACAHLGVVPKAVHDQAGKET